MKAKRPTARKTLPSSPELLALSQTPPIAI